jgi:aryl-alcohol dehydrogenase-like predicted oxidoreductase
MVMRQLGDSELQVPGIIFGAWAIGGWWWGGTDDDLAVDAIRAAVDAGITCVDTAPMYGFGHSEVVCGKALKGIRDKVILATKCGLCWDRTDGEPFFDTQFDDGTPTKIHRVLKKGSILRECEDSLRRMEVDVIDVYQCHWMDSTTPLEETMEALLQLKQEGKIRAIGVSNFTPEAIAKCQEMGPIASNQPKYSLLDRHNVEDVINWTHAHNVGTIVYSPLEQGILTGKVTMDRTFAETDARTHQTWFKLPNRQRALDVLASAVQPIADAHSATLGQVCLAATLMVPGITSAIVGARNAQQVAENAAAGSLELSAEEFSAIMAAFEGMGAPE